MTDPKPAMTMREIREQLGHQVPPPGVPDAEVLPVRFVVSSVPEGHNARHAYTINVHYRGEGLYSVGHGLAYADGDGAWSYEPSRSGEDDEHDDDGLAWIAAHRFDLPAALRLARRLAPTLTVRGRSVADALAEDQPAAVPQPFLRLTDDQDGCYIPTATTKRPPMDPVHILGIGSDEDCSALRAALLARQQPPAGTACSDRPCNAAADELCDNHAQIKYHADGEHAFCGPECTEGA